MRTTSHLTGSGRSKMFERLLCGLHKTRGFLACTIGRAELLRSFTLWKREVSNYRILDGRKRERGTNEVRVYCRGCGRNVTMLEGYNAWPARPYDTRGMQMNTLEWWEVECWYKCRGILIDCLLPKHIIIRSTVVKVLCYKPEGRWFDPSWCQWIFYWHKILPIASWPWGRLSL